jgi:LuxR family maltose regulon positive regulatory protein
MSVFLLTTKLYIPPLRAQLVQRPRLVDRLEEGLSLGHRLTLISAPAGAWGTAPKKAHKVYASLSLSMSG